MKKLLYIFLSASLMFLSCEQEDQQPTSPTTPTTNTGNTSATIIGGWDCFEWNINYTQGYWTSYPNGQKVTTSTNSETENFWLDLFFLTDGTVIGIDEDGYSMPGDWIKNGDTLIVGENIFTISTLSTFFLTVHSSESDTNTNSSNPVNDTIYFTERSDTIKWERSN